VYIQIKFSAKLTANLPVNTHDTASLVLDISRSVGLGLESGG